MLSGTWKNSRSAAKARRVHTHRERRKGHKSEDLRSSFVFSFSVFGLRSASFFSMWREEYERIRRFPRLRSDLMMAMRSVTIVSSPPMAPLRMQTNAKMSEFGLTSSISLSVSSVVPLQIRGTAFHCCHCYYGYSRHHHHHHYYYRCQCLL